MIETQLNDQPAVMIEVTHILDLPQCCPRSGNPQPGSTIDIKYSAKALFLEVASMKKFLQTYVGGKDNIRSMEGMIQHITQACANVLNVRVCSRAILNIKPEQKMVIETKAIPSNDG